jgi:signal transduction histidine kinase
MDKDNELSLLNLVENALLNNTIIQIQRGTELTNMHGKNYVVKGAIAPMYNDRMQAVGVLITVQDITENIQLEKTFIHAEKIATIGVLASGFAHEISNPLAAIVHGIENIKRRINPEFKANKDLAKICNVNMDAINKYIKQRNILQILDGLHEVSIRASNITKSIMRLDINKPYLGCKENINHIISSRIIQTNKEKFAIIRAHKINFSVELDHSLPEVVCIRNDLDFVILSLLNNAIEAIAENKIEKPIIEIKSYYVGQHAFIHISDFGKKIPSKIVDHMFDPFYTSTPARSGLGLFLSYFIIVNKHHGTFQYSYEHKYLQNIFTLSLPLH